MNYYYPFLKALATMSHVVWISLSLLLYGTGYRYTALSKITLLAYGRFPCHTFLPDVIYCVFYSCLSLSEYFCACFLLFCITVTLVHIVIHSLHVPVPVIVLLDVSLETLNFFSFSLRFVVLWFPSQPTLPIHSSPPEACRIQFLQ